MFRRVLIGIFFLVVINGSAWGENLLLNGDFEDGSAHWTEWNCPGDWVDDVFSHDYGHGLNVWTPVPYPLDGVNTHGQHVGTTNVHGGIYQVVAVTPGETYTVSGLWSGGVGGLNDGTATNASWLEVVVYDGVATVEQIDAAPEPADVLIAKRDWSGAGGHSFELESFSGEFVAVSNQVTLAFKVGKVGDWDAIASYHDKVVIERLAAIPTLSEWGMIIVSIILTISGVLMMRRKARFACHYEQGR